MITWATFKEAAKEYSVRAPLKVFADWTPVYNVKQQSFPDNVFGVDRIDYGDWAPLYDVETGGTDCEEQCWNDTEGYLYLNPAPSSGTIAVVWLQAHQPDENTQTFPTIPALHLRFVEELELAASLEADAEEILKGPIVYTIGQTQISRETAAGDLLRRAASLRFRVYSALDTALGMWG